MRISDWSSDVCFSDLQGHYMPYDFAFFLEVGFASLIGMYVAFLGASLFRPWGVSHQVHRFLCREALEIARLSHSATRRARDLYIQRALDRLSGRNFQIVWKGGREGKGWYDRVDHG